jgi:hypothetical protein
MKKTITRTQINFRGHLIPVIIWDNTRTDFSYIINDDNEILFTDGHCLECGHDWVPISTSIPSTCTPRECLPSGEIKTLEDYALIYFKDKKILGLYPDGVYQSITMKKKRGL